MENPFFELQGFPTFEGYALCRRPLTIAHCFKIADSLHICKRILDYRCPNLPFGMPPLQRPGGPWNDPGTLASRGKDVLRSRLGFLVIFGGFRDSILKVFWVPWIQKCVCQHGSLLSAGTCRCSQLRQLIASTWSNETLLAPGGCHLGGLVPPIWYPGDHFGTSGPPWRTLGAAGWTRGSPERDFHGFWVDLGSMFWEFFGQ